MTVRFDYSDGVVALSEKQLVERIEQLSKLPGQEKVISELNRGLDHVHKLGLTPAPVPTATAPQPTKIGLGG